MYCLQDLSHYVYLLASTTAVVLIPRLAVQWPLKLSTQQLLELVQSGTVRNDVSQASGQCEPSTACFPSV